jgi:hypothetical protein
VEVTRHCGFVEAFVSSDRCGVGHGTEPKS